MRTIERMYKTLLDYYGPQHWWPAETRLEMITGAILTQDTSWRNVEKALANLRKRNLLDISALAQARINVLREAVYPSGFYNQKAERLRLFSRHVKKTHNGSLEQFLSLPAEMLERELLSREGIGKETAHSIMLYAADYPVFVIDAYTIRVCRRVGIHDGRDKEELRRIFHEALKVNVEAFKECHALLVVHAKSHCKKEPMCEGCPLRKTCRRAVGEALILRADWMQDGVQRGQSMRRGHTRRIRVQRLH